MKSVKPGRGPSMMGGIGSIAVGLFGIVWTVSAASMGAPGFFVFFGIIFIGIAVVQAVYNFKNATSENRMSLFDITEHEPDPLDERYRNQPRSDEQVRHKTMTSSIRPQENNLESSIDSNGTRSNGKVNFCPGCGQNVSGKTYNYCPGCGMEISNV